MAQCKYCLIKSSTITLADNVLTITFPEVTTINNRDTLMFRICQSLPFGATSADKVNFVINGGTFSVLMQNGNTVRANQIKRCRTYVATVGTETPTMVIKCYLPATGLTYPTFSPTTTVTTTGGEG